MPRRKEPHIPDAVLDQLLAGADPRTALEPNGLLDNLKKALAGLSGISCAAGRLNRSGHGGCEALAEQDGEL
jgi:hypothetical protein